MVVLLKPTFLSGENRDRIWCRMTQSLLHFTDIKYNTFPVYSPPIHPMELEPIPYRSEGSL